MLYITYLQNFYFSENGLDFIIMITNRQQSLTITAVMIEITRAINDKPTVGQPVFISVLVSLQPGRQGANVLPQNVT